MCNIVEKKSPKIFHPIRLLILGIFPPNLKILWLSKLKYLVNQENKVFKKLNEIRNLKMHFFQLDF